MKAAPVICLTVDTASGNLVIVRAPVGRWDLKSQVDRLKRREPFRLLPNRSRVDGPPDTHSIYFTCYHERVAIFPEMGNTGKQTERKYITKKKKKFQKKHETKKNRNLPKNQTAHQIRAATREKLGVN